MNSKESANPPDAGAAVDTREQGSAGGWKMPKPKFQQTSGYLPKGYAAAVEKKLTEASSDSSKNIASPQPAEVQPQPELTEQLESPQQLPSPDTAPRAVKYRVGWVYIVLGIGLVLVLLLAFLLVVYFLFIAPASPDGPF